MCNDDKEQKKQQEEDNDYCYTQHPQGTGGHWRQDTAIIKQ